MQKGWLKIDPLWIGYYMRGGDRFDKTRSSSSEVANLIMLMDGRSPAGKGEAEISGYFFLQTVGFYTQNIVI